MKMEHSTGLQTFVQPQRRVLVWFGKKIRQDMRCSLREKVRAVQPQLPSCVTSACVKLVPTELVFGAKIQRNEKDKATARMSERPQKSK